MTEERKKHYEIIFQHLCDINQMFENIRKILGCEEPDTYDDPVNTAIDSSFEHLIYLYLEEEFSVFGDIWDEMWEDLYCFFYEYKYKNEKFSLNNLDETIVKCLNEFVDREYAYPEEIDEDWECVL